MEKIELEISGISYSYSQSGAYTLILSESGAERKLPIIIGQFEAQSIAIEMEKMKPARPLTHDLFREFSKSFSIKLNEVIINKFVDGVFHSILVFEKENKIHQIDSRTSDAVALAIRFNCPIYTSEEILAEVGVVFDEGDFAIDDSIDSDDDLTAGDDDMKLFSLEELEDMLKEAVDMEDFEKASKLRDEINKRKDIS
ncbi:MAG: bifunctional nuclease family protein [Bacteroidales bacterium]|nr:bifunctional nuclease family protein [Bacteroidales bacterium]